MKTVKRPLAVIGFTFFITGSLVLSLSKEWTVLLLAVFAVFILIHYKTKKVFTKTLLLIFVTAFTAVCYVNTFDYFYQKTVEDIPVDKQTCIGYIKDINNPENTSYIVNLLDENYKEIYSVSIYYSGGYELGDIVQITGKFRPAKRDKYIFSNYSQNIKGSISVDEMKRFDAEVSSVKYKALTIKKRLLESAAQLFSKEYLALVSAISYNDNHLVTSGIKRLFKTAGMSHTLVVSGLHVGIIMLAVQKFFKYIAINKKIKNVLAAAVIIVYMQVVGMSPSVIRAGFIAAAVLLSRNINKEQDFFTVLALVGLLSAVSNPYITRNIGAMLSYSACTGIILANQWSENKKLKDTARNLVCAAAAVLFTAPVLAIGGMYVTLMSPLYNLMLAPFIMVICIISVFAPIINSVPVIRVICPLLVIANKFLINTLLNTLSFIDEYLDFTTINLQSPLWAAVIFAATAAYFIAFFQIEQRKHKKIFIIAVSFLAFVCYNLLNYNVVTVTAFDSGREASFHISARNSEYLVLTEDVTADDAENILDSALYGRFKTVYYCPKEFKTDIDMSSISDRTIEVDETLKYKEKEFELHSYIEKNNKLFVITVADCDIAFGHGKVTKDNGEYYFLGNDKPKYINAEEIYIFGNTPSWMNVDNINNIDSDLKIRINLKNGKYKTVKDVFNFGCRI